MERNEIDTRYSAKLEPYNLVAISKNGDYYTSSARTVRNLLEKLCRAENFSDTWKEIFVTEKEIPEVHLIVSTNDLLI